MSTSTEQAIIRANVRVLRDLAGMSQGELAEKLRRAKVSELGGRTVSQPMISQVENGDVFLDEDAVEALARALWVPSYMLRATAASAAHVTAMADQLRDMAARLEATRGHR